MAITDISISQDNIVSGSNLIPIHSPVIFIVDVTYTGLVPEQLNVELYDKDSVLLSTYKCIPYADPLSTIRQFMFIADEPIRSLMNGFEDVAQLNETFVAIPDITKLITLKFVDPDNALIFDNLIIDFVHGAEQFGNNPNLVDQFNNEDDNYFAPENSFVYVYFYNDDITNSVSINEEILQLVPDELNIAIGGSTGNVITVTSNGSWLATESETWISLSTPSGTLNGSFTIDVDANATGLARSGTVTVTQGALIKTVTVNQATNSLAVNYKFDLTINEDVDTATDYEAWRLVDISPLNRTGNSINVGLDYDLSVSSVGTSNAIVYYGIGSDAVTEPTTWILLASAVTNALGGTDSEIGSTTIEVADGEFLFIKNDLRITSAPTDTSTVNLDLANGSILLPGTGTALPIAPGAWDKNINGGA